MRALTTVSTLLALPFVLACGADQPEAGQPAAGSSAATETGSAEPGVVEVVAQGLTFSAPDELPGGWTTFRFRNESPMVHFAVVELMPEGRGAAEQQEQIAPVFQRGMDLLAAGEMDAAMAEFGNLPAWMPEIVFMGGPGLTGPGQVSEATVYLEPGTYILECYVKTAGVFHSYNPDPAVFGMVHQFIVTGESNGAEEPDGDVRVGIGSEGGIILDGAPSAGETTFAVTFDDQTVHENFVGHDVHLARLPEGMDPAEVEAWMDWTDPDGLQTPAPVTFLGGLNEMPAGSTGYFTVELEPGAYVLVAEVPGTVAKGMLRAFTVEG